jgi:hypothetical protein
MIADDSRWQQMTADDSRWQTIIAELWRLQVEVTDYTTDFSLLGPPWTAQMNNSIHIRHNIFNYNVQACVKWSSQHSIKESKPSSLWNSPIKLTYQNNSTTYVREIRSLLIILRLRRPSKVFMIFALSLTAMIQWRVMKTTMSVVWKAILYSY